MKTVSNIQELIDVIGAGNPDPSSKGPVVVEVRAWDNRIVKGSYYCGSRKPDVDSDESIIMDDDLLRPHVEALLGEGKSFIIRSGESDDTCILEWAIS